MCEFFSAIATRTGRLLFTERDSHETIITRARLRDTDAHVRHWVRVEVRPQGAGWGPVRVDETTVPAWWTDEQPAWEGRVLDLAARVRVSHDAYKAVQQPAWAAYAAVVQPARAAYAAVVQPARAAYAAVQLAQAAYKAVQQLAWAAYDAVQQPAWAAYVKALSPIEGYVTERI